MQTFLEHWATQILYALPNLLTAVAIFAAGYYLARLAANILRGVLRRRGVAPHIGELLAQTVYWALLVIGLITALQRFFDVTAFLAGLGILGFTVGFALQDVMKNFAAGIILLLQQPFRVGEAISVAGFEGSVLAIDLRATEMSTFDGQLVSIPNATVLTNPITNFTRASRRRVELPLEVSPRADLDTTRRIVLDAIRQAPGVINDPEPSVVLQQIAGNSVKLTGTFWVDMTKGNPGMAKDVTLLRIKRDFEQRDVLMPAPEPVNPPR